MEEVAAVVLLTRIFGSGKLINKMILDVVVLNIVAISVVLSSSLLVCVGFQVTVASTTTMVSTTTALEATYLTSEREERGEDEVKSNLIYPPESQHPLPKQPEISTVSRSLLHFQLFQSFLLKMATEQFYFLTNLLSLHEIVVIQRRRCLSFKCRYIFYLYIQSTNM